MKTKHLTIQARVSAGFALVIAMSAFVAGASIWQIYAIGKNVQLLANNWMPRVQILGELRDTLAGIRIAELQTVTSADGKSQVPASALSAKLLSNFDAYRSLVSDKEEKQQADRLKSSIDLYLGAVLSKANNAREPNSSELSNSLIILNTSKVYADTSEIIAELILLSQEGSQTAAEDASKSERGAIEFIGLTVTLSVLIGLVALYLSGKLISVPLAFAASIAKRISQGDLTVSAVYGRRDEVGALMESIEDMRCRLAVVVSDVLRNAEGVAGTSAEVAAGNYDLSGRTENQASALEQTAASMEELTTTIQHNAANAAQASRMSTDASAIASDGREAMDSVTATMRKIQQSSGRISEIIGTVDSIAFQTNILALNAAVEAARAGELGRGFAVVAAEVRTLAQRSAEASRQIKLLITQSVQQVQEGQTVADRAGATMQQIVLSIESVAQIVSRISIASSEQSAGVAQVRDALSQMDAVTQQNAALVEESSAASITLQQQAERLVNAVEYFRI